MARSYYVDLYTAGNVVDYRPHEWTFPSLTHSDKRWLNRAVSPLEVKQALFQMDGRKSPGADGILAGFFQRFWHITGDPLTRFIQQAFRDGCFPPAMNHTLISLIPKQHPPECMAHFRPISLCNVVVKVISKVVANRLKPLMSKLTSANQSSFVHNRQAADNIIVVQEVVHTLRRKQGRIGGLIAKIDLEKAYDRIDWKFLQAILEVVGFSLLLTKLVMFCISSAQLSVLWNGQQLTAFAPSRGLRQGDPLSPYLFVLCMETLAHRIQRATDQHSWKAIKVCRLGPAVSHIFFADGLLLVGEATLQQAQVLGDIL